VTNLVESRRQHEESAVVELPNPNAIFGGEVELIRLLDREGGVPRIEIADRERAVLGGRVTVFDQELAQGLGTSVNAPTLGIGKEELLISGEAVDRGRFLAVEGGTIGVVRRRETREVSNVLTQCLLTVHAEISEGFVLIKLSYEGFARRFELL
jgi:hypothetical protein